MKDIKIPIEEQSVAFEKHLDEDDNERIIFSAAFGAGKTYFLREFFNATEKDYLTVKLAPVNYSIASNEDIFKLIKFDILFELLAHHGAKQPGKIKIRPDIFFGIKLVEKADTFFTSIATFFGTLNKDIKDATEAITALALIYSQATEFVNADTQIEDNPEVNTFLKQIFESYSKEADDITGFIESTLNQLADTTETNESNKIRKKILVIDDLDRLDPEHIFRLFNVFSAHFDYNQSTRNKFGFDKVIFVCDIQNIRHIFHSRYGAETDFSGYIDKFFSQEVFYFSNEKFIKNYVDNLLDSIRLESNNEFIKLYFNTHILHGANHREKWISFYVLLELIISGALKPRRIYSSHKTWVFPTEIINIPVQYRTMEVHVNCIPTIVSIQLLSSILGGGEQLLRAVKHAATQPRSTEYYNVSDSSYSKRLTSSLLIIDYQEHKFETNIDYQQKKSHQYTHPDGRVIEYTIGQEGNRRELYYSMMTDNSQDIRFFELLPVMVQKLLDSKLIR